MCAKTHLAPFSTTREGRVCGGYLKRNTCAFLVLVLLCVIFALPASAQRNRAMYNYGGSGGGTTDYGINFGTDWDMPLGDLANVYKAAPSFHAGVIKYYHNWTFGANLGYREFHPKQDSYTQTYIDSITNTSYDFTESYSNFTSIAIYASALYNIEVSDQVKFFLGANAGTYYTHFSASAGTSADATTTTDLTESETYLAPRAGVSFRVGYALDLNLEAKYNFFSSASYSAGTNSRTGSYSSSSGNTYGSWAAGLSLSYRF